MISFEQSTNQMRHLEVWINKSFLSFSFFLSFPSASFSSMISSSSFPLIVKKDKPTILKTATALVDLHTRVINETHICSTKRINHFKQLWTDVSSGLYFSFMSILLYLFLFFSVFISAPRLRVCKIACKCIVCSSVYCILSLRSVCSTSWNRSCYHQIL